ncbi:hypothetical protein OAN15_02065, partial [bacterium]|nr:hypothetical protein [bacterium]
NAIQMGTDAVTRTLPHFMAACALGKNRGTCLRIADLFGKNRSSREYRGQSSREKHTGHHHSAKLAR